MHKDPTTLRYLLKAQGCFTIADFLPKWQKLLGCDVTIGHYQYPIAMVGFRNLVGVGIGPFSKKLAVKY